MTPVIASTETIGATRRAIVESGWTRAAVSREAGIGYALVHGFMGGTKGLSLTTAQKILDALGYRIELLQAKPTKRRAKP